MPGLMRGRRGEQLSACHVGLYTPVGATPAEIQLAEGIAAAAAVVLAPDVAITVSRARCQGVQGDTRSSEDTLVRFERETRGDSGFCVRLLLGKIRHDNVNGIAYVGRSCRAVDNAAVVFTLTPPTAVYVTVHELLHVLGLDHSPVPVTSCITWLARASATM